MAPKNKGIAEKHDVPRSPALAFGSMVYDPPEALMQRPVAKVEKIGANPRYSEAARAAVAILEHEDGPAEAVQQIEIFIEHRRSHIGATLNLDEDF